MGAKLFDNVTQATGLPEDLISKELKDVIERKGLSPETLTLEDLRQVMTEYLQDVLVEAKEFFEQE